MTLNLRQLEIFRAVMSTGTVTNAAVALQKSQPAVSQSLRHLEDQLGYQLFSRVKGKLQPTAEANLLFAEVDRIFYSLSAVTQFSRSLRDAKFGTLSIAATPILSCTFLTEAVRRLRLLRPKVNVWIQVMPTRDIINAVRNQQIDFGMSQIPHDALGLTETSLFETEVSCIMHKNHPLAGRSRITAQDVIAYPIIVNVRNEIIKQLISEAFDLVDFPNESVISTNQVMTTFFLAQAELGVALVEPLGLPELFPDLVKRPFAPRIAMHSRLFHSPDRAMSRVGKAFLEIAEGLAADFRSAAASDRR